MDGRKVKKKLSSGLVLTGNDNSNDEGFFDRDSEYIKEWDWRKEDYVAASTRNKYYMKNYNDYDWYFKGN